MNFLKKTIFLSNNEKNKGMAILSLESKNGNVFGRLKMYSDFHGQYVLGIKCGDNIIKQNINLSSSSYTFLSDKINLKENIGCAILDVSDGKISSILWGSEKKENCKSQIVETLRESINRLSSTIPTSNILSSHADTSKNQENSPNLETQHEPRDKYSQISLEEEILDRERELVDDENEEEYDGEVGNYESEDEENDKMEKSSEVAVACSAQELFDSTQEEIDATIDRELHVYPQGKHQFYDMIADQLNELFLRYPKEENLCKLIENSDWVKIDTEIDDKFHVVGIIYNGDDIRYICYGVPGSYHNEPPMEMRDYSQWLPVDTLDPYSHGYWVMYQDADTGENIVMN